MKDRETDSYELLKRLSFPRFGGTEDELKAARLLMDEITSFGGKAELMEFPIPAYTIEKAEVTVTAPYAEDIECVAMGLSGEIDKELRLVHIPFDGDGAFLGHDDLTGCAVLVESPLEFDYYKHIFDRHGEAIIVIADDKYYQDGATTDLVSRALREHFQTIGAIPTFTIRSKDGNRMVLREAERVHVTLKETASTATSRNVLAVIEGTQPVKGEDIVLTAHYDSVTVGNGAWDNATGSVTLMYIYEHFLTHRPKRTLRFVWCGSEEQGLYGSKAYVARYPELVKDICFCFNFDMCGTALGGELMFVTGGEDLKTIVEQMGREYGAPVKRIEMTVHSSDSTPFAQAGVPAVGLSRGCRPGEIHTRYDQLELISPKALRYDGEFYSFMVDRFANSKLFPVKRELPDKMKEEVRKYFKTDKLEALAKERGEQPEGN